MSQQDILDYLKKDKYRWFSAKQISEEIDLSIGCTTRGLMILREANMVLSMIVKKPRARYIYQHRGD